MHRILAIQVKQIGDVLLTLPALRVLRRHHPDAHITFAVSSPAAELAPLFPCADRVLGIGKGHLEPNIWMHIGARSYDATYDFSGTDRARFLCFLSGARERVGFSKHGKRIFGRNDYTHSSEVALKESHTIDYFIRLLSSIGIAPTQEPLTATLPDSSRNDLPEELREATVLNASRESNKEMGYAVIHPGTARPEKYWRSDRWAEVIKHVSSQGLTPVITGAAGEEEVAHVSQIKAALDGNVPVIDLVGKLSFLESAQVISQCRIFLGVDTAAMHLASAFQRSLVALFGPTSAFRWRPRNPEARVILSGQDAPVTRFQMNDEAGDMSAISSRSVLDAIDALLTEQNPSERVAHGEA